MRYREDAEPVRQLEKHDAIRKPAHARAPNGNAHVHVARGRTRLGSLHDASKRGAQLGEELRPEALFGFLVPIRRAFSLALRLGQRG